MLNIQTKSNSGGAPVAFNPTQWDAAESNSMSNEMKNVVSNYGNTPVPLIDFATEDTNQVSRAIAAASGFISNPSAVTSSLASFTPASIGVNLFQALVGMVGKSISFWYTASATNTGAYQISWDGTVDAVINRDGSPLLAGQIIPGNVLKATWDGTDWILNDKLVSDGVYINVQWFGAVGDGVADDTVPFQTAFTLLNTFGGTLVVPRPSSSYLIDGEIGLDTSATTNIHVMGFGSKIKQKVTASPYIMFRYRSNMTITDIELEGYIASGVGVAALPTSSYGFKTKEGVGNMDNVVFNGCRSDGHSFDGWYVRDATEGGDITLLNCSGNNNQRNDFQVAMAASAIVDGGIWGNHTYGNPSESSINFASDFLISNGSAKNLTCFHKISFGITETTNDDAYYGSIDNIIFDGSIFGSICGVNGSNWDSLTLGQYKLINGAELVSWNANTFIPVGGRVGYKGRFLNTNKGQPQAPNKLDYTTAKKAGWTETINGAATILDGPGIGDRLGIGIENGSGGFAYLKITVPATPGEQVSFGCLIEADGVNPVHNAGMWVVCVDAIATSEFTLKPSTIDTVEKVCGTFITPAGTTTFDVFIGSDTAADTFDLTFADMYICRGVVDNEESVAYSLQKKTAYPIILGEGIEAPGGLPVDEKITASKGILIAGGVSEAGAITKLAASGLTLKAVTGSSYDVLVESVAGDALIRNPTGTSTLGLPESVLLGKRIQEKKGSDIASTIDVTLLDGNFFVITGTNNIQRISDIGWQAGSRVILNFISNLTITHNAAPSGNNKPFFFKEGSNFVINGSGGGMLDLVYSGTFWREVSKYEFA